MEKVLEINIVAENKYLAKLKYSDIRTRSRNDPNSVININCISSTHTSRETRLRQNNYRIFDILFECIKLYCTSCPVVVTDISLDKNRYVATSNGREPEQR